MLSRFSKAFAPGKSVPTSILANRPIVNQETTVPIREKSKHVVATFADNAEIVKMPENLKIKDLNNKLVPVKLDRYHSIFYDPETGTAILVATSAEEYPKGRKNACLNPHRQLNGNKKAQYAAETQVTIRASKESIIIDKEKTNALHNQQNRHAFGKILRDSRKNGPKPEIVVDIVEKDKDNKN